MAGTAENDAPLQMGAGQQHFQVNKPLGVCAVRNKWEWDKKKQHKGFFQTNDKTTVTNPLKKIKNGDLTVCV